MRREETAKIISLIKISFPQQYSNIDERSLDLLVEEWNLQFKNETYESVYVAMQHYISTNVYPPTIAGIKNLMYEEDSESQFPSGEEAWEIVYRSGRCQREYAYEEYENLPKELKQIVTPETLYEIGNASNESILYIKNGFLKDYHRIQESHKREYQISSISNDIKKLDGGEGSSAPPNALPFY